MKTRIKSTLIVLTLLFPGLLPKAQAVSPAPDGCYPGFTTAEGCKALNFLTTGAGNTGVGWYSLYVNTSGSYNTGLGAGTLALNNADSDTAVGAAALLLNTTGTENVAVGTDALVYNDTAQNNTATGAFALFSHISGNGNTAMVGTRSIAIPPAKLTRRSARPRSRLLTAASMAASTRPSVPARFLATPAATIPLSALARSERKAPTLLATTIQRSVLLRSKPIPPALKTRPSVAQRCSST